MVNTKAMTNNPKPRSFIVSIALAVGLMLSPDSLIILGNNIGTAGISFLISVVLAMIAMDTHSLGSLVQEVNLS